MRTLHKSQSHITVNDTLVRNTKDNRKFDPDVPEWTKTFSIKDPELDLDYLLKPENLQEIGQNIVNRKGVGNIEKLVSIRLGQLYMYEFYLC